MSDRDPDDWFDEAAPPARRPAPADEDWTLEFAQGAPRRRGRPRADNRAATRAVFAAVLVAALLLALWLAGVFGSSGRRATPPQTTTAPPTTSTVTTPAHPQVPLPTVVLAPGSTGAQVKRLQRALAAAGYSPGAIDGDYGPSTVEAVTKFQRANGLQPDGALGPQTLQALQTALAQ